MDREAKGSTPADHPQRAVGRVSADSRAQLVLAGHRASERLHARVGRLVACISEILEVLARLYVFGLCRARPTPR